MVAVVTVVVLVLGGVLAGLLVNRGRPAAVETAELRFGPEVSEDAVWGVLAGISGLPTSTRVALEVVGDAEGIRHYLRAEADVIGMLRSHLRGLLPGVRVESVQTAAAPAKWRVAARLRWGGRHPLLRSDRGSETAAALLGALSGLRGSERVLVRWTFTPARGPFLVERPVRSQAHEAVPLSWLWREPPVEAAHLPALRSKYGGPVLLGQLVVAAWAGSEGRGVNLLTRVLAVLRARSGLRGRPVVRYAHAGRVERLVAGRSRGGGSRFSPAELTGMLGWPIDAPRVPGLVLGVAPQLMPSAKIPRGGRVLAHATWPGMEGRPLAQPLVGALSQMVVAGPSGVGKSALLASIAAQDIAAGRGCLVLDGKGDLADEVLGLVGERYQDKVIVLDPGRAGAVPGLRVFGGGDPELSGDLVLGMFRSIFIDSWGVRSDKWLRAGLVTLAYDRTATLADLPFLFASDAYRRRLTGRLSDPLLRATWAEFEAMSREARAQQLGSPLQKVNELVGRRVVRSVLAQTEPKWDMRAVLAKGQVVIVRLSPGVIGAPASRLLAALVIHELFQAVQARSQVPAARRHPFMVYIDEPRVFTDISLPLDSLFELARGLGVGMTLSVQSISQLPPELARAALTNAATLVAFRQNYDDAKLLAHELPGVSAEELQALGRFEIAARIGLGPGDVSPSVTGRTLPPPEPLSDPEVVRAASAARYGRAADEVDAALLAEHGLGDQAVIDASAAPLRRRRRSES